MQPLPNITSNDQVPEPATSPESHNTGVDASTDDVVDISGTNIDPPQFIPSEDAANNFLQPVDFLQAGRDIMNFGRDPFRLVDCFSRLNLLYSSADFRLIEEELKIGTGEEPAGW